jgi:hypothetical protein
MMDNDAEEIVQLVDFEEGVVWGGNFRLEGHSSEWCWRGCVGGGFWGGGGGVVWEEGNPVVLHRVFWEVEVPSSSLFCGETIDEEQVFRIISLWGHRMKFRIASFSFSIPSSSSG